MRISLWFLALLGALTLSGCSVVKWGDDGAGDYTRSVSLSSLHAPAGLVTPGGQNDRFSVPGEGGDKLNPGLKVQTPKLPEGARLRIERQGQLYWVASDHKPSVLWPHLKNFWRVNDFSLANIDQRNGLLTTHWAPSRIASLKDVEHEYRMRVIPFQKGSRVFITIRSRKNLNGQMQAMSSSAKLEMAMLSKLHTYLSGL